MVKSPMTTRGAQKLRDELHMLKTKVRPGIIKAIAHARSLGDLSENAEYHAAREEQGFAEGRIASIESKLHDADIIDVTKINAHRSAPRAGSRPAGATARTGRRYRRGPPQGRRSRLEGHRPAEPRPARQRGARRVASSRQVIVGRGGGGRG